MPVVAVVGGIAAAAGGAAAFTAAGGFAAGITAATVVSGLTVVSGVTTALGALTGNKTLSKIGMVTGLGALAVGGANALMSSAADVATDVAATVPPVEKAVAPTLIEAEASKVVNPSVQGITNDFLIGADAPETFLTTRNQGGLLSQPITSKAPELTSVSASPRPVIELSKPIAEASRVPLGNMNSSAPSSVMDTVTGAFKGLGTFANENKGLTQLGLGMLSSVGQAQMAEAKMAEEERIKEANRRRYNNSILAQRQAY